VTERLGAVSCLLMAGFLEATLLLYPADAGGRQTPIAPREGTYRAWAGGGMVRFIEGPPAVAPGSEARVVVEIELPLDPPNLIPGAEIELVEDERNVGLLVVTRFWRVAV